MMNQHLGQDQPTLDQRRAKDAMNKVDDVLKMYPDKAWQDSYADYVERLPATILTNGLGQALAQLLAAAQRGEKTEDPHYLLYKHVSDWLCQKESKAPYSGEEDILQAIINGGRSSYMHAQAEALAWLEWHKKLAVAYLKQPEGGAK